MDLYSNYPFPTFELDSDHFINTLFQEEGFSAETPSADFIYQNSGFVDGREVELVNDNSSISTPRTNELRSPVCTLLFYFLTYSLSQSNLRD